MKIALRILLNRIGVALQSGATPVTVVLASLWILGGGCATDDDGLSVRVIEIRVTRTEADFPDHPGLSAVVATNLFQEAASRLDSLGRVNSVHHYNPEPSKPAFVEYAVSFTPEGAYTVDLTMDIDGKYITFRGEGDIDPKTDAALQKAMKLFQESLDRRRIRYRVRAFSTHETMIPASTARKAEDALQKP
jgi:hypothetical protein